MSEEKVRLNVRVSKTVQQYYKDEANRYNVPYTTYISMILTKIYEEAEAKKKV